MIAIALIPRLFITKHGFFNFNFHIVISLLKLKLLSKNYLKLKIYLN